MTADKDLRIVQILTDGDECLLIDISVSARPLPSLLTRVSQYSQSRPGAASQTRPARQMNEEK